MLAAFLEAATGRAPMMLRAYLLAVLIQMLAVNALAEYGFLRAAIPPFFGLATVLGGVIYGWGMYLAVGCAGAVLYRVGEGKFDYILAMLGYVIAAWASNNWITQPLRAFLGGAGATLALHQAIVLDRWVIVAAFLIAGMLWLLRGKRPPDEGGWNWARTGLALGIIGILAWTTSAMAGKPAGLGTMQGSDNLATLVLERNLSALDWSLLMLVGAPLGSAIAARRRGVSYSKPARFEHIPQAILGGALMGLGAAVAAGDNVLHGLSGVPLLAVSSLAFMLGAFVGVWTATRVKGDL